MKKLICFLALFMVLISSSGNAKKVKQEKDEEETVVNEISKEIAETCFVWVGGKVGKKVETLPCRTVSELSKFVLVDVFRNKETVVYRSEDGKIVYRVEPVYGTTFPDFFTKCQKVRERIWADWHLVKDNVVEFCEKVLK